MTLHDIVERERRGVARHLGLATGAWLLAAGLVVVLVATFVLGNARWLSLPRVLPFLVWLLIAGAAIPLFRRLRGRARQETSLHHLARTVERERRLRAGSLRGVLEVSETGVLGRLGAEQMAERLHAFGGKTLAPTYRQQVLKRVGVGLGAAVAGVLAVVTAAVAAPDGFRAVLNPIGAWRGTLVGEVTLGEVPGSVLRGERLSITVRAPGRRTIEIAQRVTGSSWRSAEYPVSGDSVSLPLGPLDADLALFASDGRSTSDTALVRVVDRPSPATHRPSSMPLSSARKMDRRCQ
jgi:hypothetical protein